MTEAETHCLSLLRTGDRERYLSLLFAPEEKRGGLAALYAFNLETARIRDVLREPLAGEIRLRWWHDKIENHLSIEAENPVLKALFAAMEHYHLPASAFMRMCDARVFDLYHDPMPSQTNLEGYLGETASTIIQLACQILDEEAAKKSGEAAGHAGVAQGLAGLIRLLPITGARGQLYIPADILSALGVTMDDLYGEKAKKEARERTLSALLALAQEHYKKFQDAERLLSPGLRPAFLSAAMVPVYLKKAQEAGEKAFVEVSAVSPLKRWWGMLHCAVTGKF